MKSTGWEPKQNTAALDLVSAENLAPLDDSDSKPGEVVLPSLVKSGSSAVSPPSNAQPEALHPSAIPFTTAIPCSLDNLPVAK